MNSPVDMQSMNILLYEDVILEARDILGLSPASRPLTFSLLLVLKDIPHSADGPDETDPVFLIDLAS